MAPVVPLTAPPPNALRYTASWPRGLRGHLLIHAVTSRLPLWLAFVGTFVASRATLALLRGGGLAGAGAALVPGPVAGAICAALAYGLQSVAGRIAGSLVMPATRAALENLVQIQSVSARLGESGGSSQLDAPIRQMQEMQSLLSPVRTRFLREGTAERLWLATPDGGFVDGFMLGREALAKRQYRGVVLYLGGNGEHYELRAQDMRRTCPLLRMAIVMINYRGVGESPGECSRNSAVVDVATVLSYITGNPADGGLGVDPTRVVVIGHSIGGGYGSEAGRFFPGLLAVNDRSFSRLSAAAACMIATPYVLGPLAATWKGYAVRAGVRFLLAHVCLWELDTVRHWKAYRNDAARSKKLIILSPADRVIPPPTQLLTLLADQGFGRGDVGAVMVMEEEDGEGLGDMHNRTWSDRELGRMRRAIDCFLDGEDLGERV
jgi:pimeloyl-ACP methyl ester carboxylesterase